METEIVKRTKKASVKTKKSKIKISLIAIRKDWQLYSLLILPIIYLLIFKYGPMLGNVIAFRRYMPGGKVYGEEWVGLYYFKMFINDPVFWNVFKNTFILGGLTLLFCFPMPILFALLLNEIKSTKFKRFVQTASYLPHFLSIVIIAGMILQLTALNGSINSIVEFFTGEKVNFIQSAEWFRTIYISSEIWQGMGWGAILYLAALTTIDQSLYEAAKIDGANRWKQTLHITIPGILPTIVTLLILNTGSFLAIGFEKILLLYNPLTYETSDVISTYLYRVGLESNNFSYATAIGLFESIIGLVLVLTANSISRKLTERSLW
ncbi:MULTISPECIES: ABC transporter permease subunit [Bacillaceae]|uniref:ABC transporter permease n=1 Tax=Bacillaceae TaxID=186817 RepID=UPI001E543A98|nr:MULTISPECIES: ABC transporter permease subunit [Bacillaceae]MCE4051373.1 ABC transporter permease subunit [Bacillus sp. Au-Bac7]MCM3029275.1 ABC transporter permease subunit [Niallia sp. MER 6]MDL0436452.1 ABC transporter permease subunit [Niallia sp. SS-2023]UPO88653.1 ABC transporter permease subunit [Niallia sp. Man26]